MLEAVDRGEAAVSAALARLVEGELRVLGEAIEALPEDNLRKRLLLANYRTAVLLLGDVAKLLRR